MSYRCRHPATRSDSALLPPAAPVGKAVCAPVPGCDTQVRPAETERDTERPGGQPSPASPASGPVLVPSSLAPRPPGLQTPAVP